MATFTRICGAKDGHSCGEVHWFVSAKTSTVAEKNWCAVHFEWGWIAPRVRAALCNPASGSARKHLPFPHSSVRCSISTRAQSSAAHSARRGTLHKSTTTGWWHVLLLFLHNLILRRCVWIKFPCHLERHDRRVGKNEDNFRLPCMMMSKNERRLVVKYISFGWTHQKGNFWFYTMKSVLMQEC